MLCSVYTRFAMRLAPAKCLTAVTQTMAHVTATYWFTSVTAKKTKNFLTSRSKPAIKYTRTAKRNGTGTSSVGKRASRRESTKGSESTQPSDDSRSKVGMSIVMR